MKYSVRLLQFVLVVAAILLAASCAVNPVTGKKQLMFVSEQQEVALGADYDPQVMATFGLYKEDKLENFIGTKGAEMGKISHRPGLQYHFKILDSPVINAFAVPGGYIYLTRGILAQLNNEAELIGIIGHEMGHVTARHTAQQMTKQQVAQVLLVGGMIASKEFRQFADVAMQGMQLLFLSFSRENEREADKLGVEYATRIGYDAHKMADFFQVLQRMQLESEQGGVPTFLSTHPDPGDRFNDVNRRATRWQDSLKTGNWLVNHDNYLRMIDGIVYGEDPRQGYIDGNVFYHPEMKFSFPIPGGWKTENTPTQVQMVSADGKAMIVFSLAQQKELDQAAASSIQSLGLTVSKRNIIEVKGLPALEVFSEKTTQNQQTGQQSSIKVISCFIDYKGNVFLFHGVSDAMDFQSRENTFVQTMKNFGPLTDPSKINVVPVKIRIKQAVKAGTLSESLSYHKVPQKEWESIALLNNLKLTDRIEAGKLIKITGK